MMNEELKLRMAALRWAFDHDDCTCGSITCPVNDECFRYISVLCDEQVAADLIESLSAELEQVKLERDGLNILLGQAQSMLETRTRERDAAVEDMQKTPITLCNACAHYHTEFPCAGGKCSNKIHLTIACSMFEWRGVKGE